MSPTNPLFGSWMGSQALRSALTTVDARPVGFVPAPFDASYTRGSQPLMSALGTIPSSYDLRTLGRVTSVKDQYQYGTCWAFATMGSLESWLMPAQNLDFSEDNLARNDGFDDPEGKGYNRGGNYLMSTAYLARWGGPVYESEDEYGDGYTPPGLTARKHVQNVDWLPERDSPTDNAAIKNAVMQYGGVAVSMYWQESSAYYNATNHSYYYGDSDPNTRENHGVLIVGWDDNYAASKFATTAPGNGAFIVKNSWGGTWGMSGYFYLSYYDTVLGVQSMPTVFNDAESAANYSQAYQYDPLGMVGSWGDGMDGDPYWGANVFTATSSAQLKAVGFYTLEPNSTYEVWAGPNLATMTQRTTGSIAHMGFHTVSLASPMALVAGQPFAVAVKITSPGYGYPIAIEYPDSGYSSAATASPGQSYESADGTNWTDITTEADLDPGLAETNICLKAYTGAALVAPTVTSVSPSTGPTTGGSSVVIRGTDFIGATGVAFGSTPASSFNVDSDTQITATSPAGTLGTVDVQVTTPGGASSTSGTDDDYTYVVVQTPTRYDQTTINIVKSGTWADYAATGAYSGSYGRSATSGASATIYFTGTRLDWIATKGTTTGYADVYVDGVKVTATPINLAATSVAYQQNVWSSGTLSSGAHNVRIVRSTASAAGRYLTLDAVDVDGTISQPPVSQTRIEQTNSAITKTGTWSNYSTTKASGSSYGRSSTSGASVTIRFIGTRLDWIAMKGTTTGYADVFVDGVKVTATPLNLYSATAVYQVGAYTTGVLSFGVHTVKIVRSASSTSGRYLTLDAFDIRGWMTS